MGNIAKWFTNSKSFMSKLGSLFAKDPKRGAKVLGAVGNRLGKKIASLDVFKTLATKMSDKEFKSFLKSTVVSVAAIYTIDEALDLLTNLASDESKETGGTDFANELRSELAATLESLKNADDVLPVDLDELDGEKGYSLTDAEIYNDSLQSISAAAVLKKRAEIAGARTIYLESQRKLKRLSELLGLRPEYALEAALLLKDIDAAYEEVI